jgi:hypothetical protein
VLLHNLIDAYIAAACIDVTQTHDAAATNEDAMDIDGDGGSNSGDGEGSGLRFDFGDGTSFT